MKTKMSLKLKKIRLLCNFYPEFDFTSELYIPKIG
jgi:hypothetical protein